MLAMLEPHHGAWALQHCAEALIMATSPSACYLHPFLVRGEVEGLPVAAQALPEASGRGWSCLQQAFAQAAMLWLTRVRAPALGCSGLSLPQLLSLHGRGGGHRPCMYT